MRYEHEHQDHGSQLRLAASLPLRQMLAFFGKSPAWPLLIGLIIVFAIGSPRFLTPLNISSVLNQAVLIGVLGIGLTPLVISGNIDLSVGSIAGFGACLLVYLEGTSIGLVFAIVLAIIACTAIGLANGLVVEGLGLNSIIVTLAVERACAASPSWFSARKPCWRPTRRCSTFRASSCSVWTFR